MVSWFTKATQSFYRRFLGTLWNDSSAKWNDHTAKWNEQDADWHTRDQSSWYTKD